MENAINFNFDDKSYTVMYDGDVLLFRVFRSDNGFYPVVPDNVLRNVAFDEIEKANAKRII